MWFVIMAWLVLYLATLFACGGLLCNFIFSSTLTLIVDQVYPLFRAGLGFHFAWEKISKLILVFGLGFVLSCIEFCTLGACALVSTLLRPTLDICMSGVTDGRRIQGKGPLWTDWIGQLADPIGPKVAAATGFSPIGWGWCEGSWVLAYFVFLLYGWDLTWGVVFLHMESHPSIHGSTPLIFIWSSLPIPLPCCIIFQPHFCESCFSSPIFPFILSTSLSILRGENASGE